MRDGYITIKGGLEGDATATTVPGVFAAGDVVTLYTDRQLHLLIRLHGCTDAEKYVDG